MIQDLFASQERMVATQIEARGIHNPQVLSAMRAVPRFRFLPEALHKYAAEDGPLPIGEGQTISQPYVVAAMTEALVHDSPHEQRVLEIGTGSGYQTAVLAELFGRVYTVERIKKLSLKAQETLRSLDYTNISYKMGNGWKGWEEHALYDGIIVTAAPSRIPQDLIEQLATGGRMVIPVGGRFSQELLLIKKIAENNYQEKPLFGVRFVELVDKG